VRQSEFVRTAQTLVTSVQLATQRAERLKAAWDEVPAMDAKRPELIFEY
jgi:hypothetical protein